LPSPGPYIAFAYGYGEGGTRQIAVEVEFAPGYSAITGIKFWPNQETPGFVSRMDPWAIEDVIEFQSTDLPRDLIENGATVTTKAFLKAVQEVLDRVGFVYVPPFAGSGDGDGPLPPSASTPPPAVSTPPTSVSTPPPAVSTPAPPPPARFYAGTHMGVSNNTYSHTQDGKDDGYTEGPIIVEITTTEHEITDMRLVASNDGSDYTGLFFGRQGQSRRDQIMRQGNTNGVEHIADATYSTRAIIEAIGNAIAAARR